ncbi:MAG TPA: dihydroxy-acid dehydratase, partial [Burkholderiaceae bacterium]
KEPMLEGDTVVWRDAPVTTGDDTVLRPASNPFARDGGMKLAVGNLGRAVMKVSAVRHEHRFVEAPALLFDSQEAFMQAYAAGQLDRDFIAVLRFQGPRANGMPELHALTPALANLQDAGRKVALVTDGRMSGASGKVPAAIHVSPEVLAGGPLGLVREGDLIRFDALQGTLDALVPAGEWNARLQASADLSGSHIGMGRELFAMFRTTVSTAETGATVFPLPLPAQPPMSPTPDEHKADVMRAEPFNDEDDILTRPTVSQYSKT